MRATVGEIELHYSVRGDGEPLLLIHGFPLSGELWEGVAERLEGEYRLIVPDLRGHGRSGVTEAAGMAHFAEDLATLLDAIGEHRPVVLVGMSMGGYVAFEFLRRYAHRVRALVLVDTRAAPDSPETARGRRETAQRVLAEGSAQVAAGMVDRLFAAGASDALRDRWRAIMAATPPEGVAAALRAMAERPDSVDTLRRFERPTLVVVGDADTITPPDEAREMAQTAPRATLRVIPNAGHMTPVEQPEALARALVEFLRGL